MGILDSFLGGIDKLFGIDQAKRAAAKDRKFQWKVLQEQLKYQREFAQQGLSWRVADAQRAGMHPLAALGAQGMPSYSPVSVQSDSSGVAAAASKDVRFNVATKTEREAALQAMRESASRVAANEAEAAYYNSMAAKESQRQVSEPAFPEVNAIDSLPPVPALVYEGGSTFGGAELVAPKVNMSRPGGAIVAGPSNPSLREYTLPGGFKMMLPAANDLGEALEPLSESWPLLYAVVKENEKHYGPDWTTQAARRYGPNWLVRLGDVIGDSQERMRRFYGGKSESLRGRYRPSARSFKRNNPQWFVK